MVGVKKKTYKLLDEILQVKLANVIPCPKCFRKTITARPYAFEDHFIRNC